MGTLYWKRIYDTAAPQDGFRILADRLWPRGITKEKAAIGEWITDIFPLCMQKNWRKTLPHKISLIP